MIDIAVQQTMPCCTALQPGRGDASVHREEGASAFLHHTGGARSPRSGGSDCSKCLHGSVSPYFSECPDRRLARLASALPPPSLRRVLPFWSLSRDAAGPVDNSYGPAMAAAAPHARAPLVITGHERRQGFTCWLGRTRARHSGSNAPRFRCPFRLPLNEGRLVPTKTCGSVLPIPRCNVRAPPFLQWAVTFSSKVARATDLVNLPSVRSTAMHINGYVRHQTEEKDVHYFRDYTNLQTLPFTLPCVNPMSILCSGHAAHHHALVQAFLL